MTIRAAILTVSDRGSRGEREDLSGPALSSWLGERGVQVVATRLVADEQTAISATLREWADGPGIDLILTTGGTGVSPSDVTPDATALVLDRAIAGFSEAMRAANARKTPHALLSRAVCGIRAHALIMNLPGSPRGAVENLESVWDAVPHAVSKIQGDMSDCAPKPAH